MKHTPIHGLWCLSITSCTTIAKNLVKIYWIMVHEKYHHESSQGKAKSISTTPLHEHLQPHFGGVEKLRLPPFPVRNDKRGVEGLNAHGPLYYGGMIMWCLLFGQTPPISKNALFIPCCYSLSTFAWHFSWYQYKHKIVLGCVCLSKWHCNGGRSTTPFIYEALPQCHKRVGASITNFQMVVIKRVTYVTFDCVVLWKVKHSLEIIVTLLQYCYLGKTT